MKKLFVLALLAVYCGILSLPVGVNAQAYYPGSMMPQPQFPSYPSPYYQPSPYGQQPYSYNQPCMPWSPYSSCVQPSVAPQCWQGGWSGPQQLYRCGLSLVYAKRYTEAIRVFQQFLNSYPQSSLADNALYWSGEAYYAQKHYYQALSYFQQVLTRYPQGNKVPDALLKIALSYMSLNRYTEGCQTLYDLQYRYPRSEPAQKSYRWMDRCGYYYGGGGSPSPQPYSSNRPLPWYSDSALPKYW